MCKKPVHVLVNRMDCWRVALFLTTTDHLSTYLGGITKYNRLISDHRFMCIRTADYSHHEPTIYSLQSKFLNHSNAPKFRNARPVLQDKRRRILRLFLNAPKQFSPLPLSHPSSPQATFFRSRIHPNTAHYLALSIAPLGDHPSTVP